MPYVPAWSTCPSAHVQRACQLVIFTCLSAKKRAHMPIVQLGVPMCQKPANFSTPPAKRRANKAYIMHTTVLVGKTCIMETEH